MENNEDMRITSSAGVIQNTQQKRTRGSKSMMKFPAEENGRKQLSVPRACECGPDLYNRILGPTADEAILAGLQTIIDLCGKLTVCGDKEETTEEEEPEKDVPERDTPPVKNQTDNVEDNQVESSRNQETRTMVSAGFQVNPIVKTAEAQTSPLAEMVSEILQTIGLTAEMADKVMQTSFIELPEAKKASLATIFMQTSNPSIRSELIQTTQLDVRSGAIQTSSGLLPRIVEVPSLPETQAATTQTSRESSLKSVIKMPSKEQQEEAIVPQTSYTVEAEKAPSAPKIEEPEEIPADAKGDEHKCIAPPEPPQKSKICKCCKCSSSSSLRESKSSQESKEVEKPCVCGQKKKGRCRCGLGAKKSNLSTEAVQQPAVEVKYAITKISKYKEFTTFEVMKSTKNRPKQVPKGIEGVFVLKKKQQAGTGDVTKEEVKA